MAGEIGAVRHQTALVGKFAIAIKCRKPTTGGQCNYPGSVIVCECIIERYERPSLASRGDIKGHLEILRRARFDRLKLQPQVAGCRFGLPPKEGMDRVERIH